jgi:diketogulonate reductase-like aldo/keto reductase
MISIKKILILSNKVNTQKHLKNFKRSFQRSLRLLKTIYIDLVNFWEEKLGIDFKSIVGEDYEVWEGWNEEKEILELDKIKEICATEKC